MQSLVETSTLPTDLVYCSEKKKHHRAAGQTEGDLEFGCMRGGNREEELGDDAAALVGRQKTLAAYSESNQPTALTMPLPIQSSEEKLDCLQRSRQMQVMNWVVIKRVL